MKKLIILASLVACLIIGYAPPARAAVTPVLDDSCHHSILFIPTWYEYLTLGDKGGETCAIIGPVDSSGEFDWGRALPRVALAVVNIMLRLSGLVAVGFTIYGGFRYILSQGEPEATKKAKGTIISASIGLIIASFAALIVGFIGNILWK